MNRYETSTPRLAFGIAAAVMTALTIGVSVVLPAQMDRVPTEQRALATQAVIPMPIGDAVAATRVDVVDVVATREAKLQTACAESHRNRQPEG